jgi:type VI secretion system protein VasJ
MAKAVAPEPTPTTPAEEAPPPAQPAAPTPPPTPPPVAAKASAPELAGGEPQSENDSKKAIRQVQTALRNTATFHLSQKLADPKGYRLTRIATWLAVDKAPPANDGVTQVVAPQAERLKVFEGKIDKADFAAVIPELEKTIARSPFWLDGHFMVVKALRGLGAEYEAAVAAVIGEVSALLARIPELIELCFNDSTPFASDQTRLWLEAEVLVSASAEGSATATDGASGEAWVEALEQAGKVAAGGDSDQALQIMNDGLRGAGSQREQVYWRCALAQLLLQIGRADAAASLLEQIVAQLDEEQLARWEPAAAAQIYRLLYQTYQKQQKKSKDDNVLADKADAAYRKLCWFDPVNALSVKGG